MLERMIVLLAGVVLEHVLDVSMRVDGLEDIVGIEELDGLRGV